MDKLIASEFDSFRDPNRLIQDKPVTPERLDELIGWMPRGRVSKGHLDTIAALRELRELRTRTEAMKLLLIDCADELGNHFFSEDGSCKNEGAINLCERIARLF